MYSKQESSNKQADVRIGTDKGSLRLQFSSRISRQFYNIKQKYIGLGNRADTPENRIWAEGIAREIQQDIDYRNGENFDITLEKYLEVRPNKVVELPSSKPIPTLGELWEEFVQWKVDTKQISELTKIALYDRNYAYLIKEYIDKPLTDKTSQALINDLTNRDANQPAIKKTLNFLSKISIRAMQQGKLHHDYFCDVAKAYTVPKKSKQLSEEEDRRAYSIKERETIINAFYNANKSSCKAIAPLIEFLFLTGMRPSETFALRWKHVDFDKGWIRIQTNYSTTTKKETGKTKNDTVRIFRLKNQNRLLSLLNTIKQDKKADDLIFTTVNNKRYNLQSLAGSWSYESYEKKGKKYHYVGVVKQLTEQGKISCYLSPYSTRHTFISIQANAGVDLALLADTCGNSVDVIIKHYLQPDKERTLLDI